MQLCECICSFGPHKIKTWTSSKLTVERMKSDLEHLQARLTSVETIVVLKENKAAPLDWWPFQDLQPKTVLFMVTWPIISQGLIQLAKVAFRKSRK